MRASNRYSFKCFKWGYGAFRLLLLHIVELNQLLVVRWGGHQTHVASAAFFLQYPTFKTVSPWSCDPYASTPRLDRVFGESPTVSQSSCIPNSASLFWPSSSNTLFTALTVSPVLLASSIFSCTEAINAAVYISGNVGFVAIASRRGPTPVQCYSSKN